MSAPSTGNLPSLMAVFSAWVSTYTAAACAHSVIGTNKHYVWYIRVSWPAKVQQTACIMQSAHLSASVNTNWKTLTWTVVNSLYATTGASPKVMTAKKLTLRELEACAAESGKKLLRTFPEMRLAFLHECGKRRINRAYALRDYYPFWKTNAERSKAGKLLLLNRRDQEHIQIMFDDNIGYGSPHIVDARDAETGQPVSFRVRTHYSLQSGNGPCKISWRWLLLIESSHMLWCQHLFYCTLLQQKWMPLTFLLVSCTVLIANVQEVNGKHLLKAEPLNAILDPQYFVRQVHECVVKVLSERMAKEQQAADQAAPFRCPTLHLPFSLKWCLQLMHYKSSAFVPVRALCAKPTPAFPGLPS